MFAFENWHSLLEFKLYMHRFLHAIDGLNDLSSLVFPKYNQFDTFVTPLGRWLKEKGVTIQLNTLVEDLILDTSNENKSVTGIKATQNGQDIIIPIKDDDYIIVTTGSMTEDTLRNKHNCARFNNRQ